jgi:hypothetical protein
MRDDVHRKAEAMADARRQLREAHRERDGLAALAMFRDLKQQESGRAAISRLRSLTEARSKEAFAGSQSPARSRAPLPSRPGGRFR